MAAAGGLGVGRFRAWLRSAGDEGDDDGEEHGDNGHGDNSNGEAHAARPQEDAPPGTNSEGDDVSSLASWDAVDARESVQMAHVQNLLRNSIRRVEQERNDALADLEAVLGAIDVPMAVGDQDLANEAVALAADVEQTTHKLRGLRSILADARAEERLAHQDRILGRTLVVPPERTNQLVVRRLVAEAEEEEREERELAQSEDRRLAEIMRDFAFLRAQSATTTGGAAPVEARAIALDDGPPPGAPRLDPLEGAMAFALEPEPELDGEADADGGMHALLPLEPLVQEPPHRDNGDGWRVVPPGGLEIPDMDERPARLNEADGDAVPPLEAPAVAPALLFEEVDGGPGDDDSASDGDESVGEHDFLGDIPDDVIIPAAQPFLERLRRAEGGRGPPPMPNPRHVQFPFIPEQHVPPGAAGAPFVSDIGRRLKAPRMLNAAPLRDAVRPYFASLESRRLVAHTLPRENADRNLPWDEHYLHPFMRPIWATRQACRIAHFQLHHVLVHSRETSYLFAPSPRGVTGLHLATGRQRMQLSTAGQRGGGGNGGGLFNDLARPRRDDDEPQPREPQHQQQPPEPDPPRREEERQEHDDPIAERRREVLVRARKRRNARLHGVVRRPIVENDLNTHMLYDDGDSLKTIPRDDITEATPGGRHYETNDFVSVSTLAADDRCLYVGGISGELVVQDIISGRILYDGFLSTHENAITNGLEIARLGGRSVLLSASNDSLVRLTDPNIVQTYSRYAFPECVNYVSGAPHDSSILLVVGDTPTTRLVDVRIASTSNAFVVGSQSDHNNFCFSCAWSPDGRVFATGSDDVSTLLYDVRNTSRPLCALPGAAASIASLRFSPSGRFLAAAEAVDWVHVYDLTTLTSDGVNPLIAQQSMETFTELAGIAWDANATGRDQEEILYHAYAMNVHNGGIVKYSTRPPCEGIRREDERFVDDGIGWQGDRFAMDAAIVWEPPYDRTH